MIKLIKIKTHVIVSPTGIGRPNGQSVPVEDSASFRPASDRLRSGGEDGQLVSSAAVTVLVFC